VIEQELADRVEVVGVGEGDLDDLGAVSGEGGGVEGGGAEQLEVVEDPAGLAVQVGADLVAALVVDLEADEGAGQGGDGGGAGVQVGWGSELEQPLERRWAGERWFTRRCPAARWSFTSLQGIGRGWLQVAWATAR